MLTVADIHPLRVIAHQACCVFLGRIQALQQVFVVAQTQHSTINLTVSDPAPQLRQNVIRDVDHRILLGKRHLEARSKRSSYPNPTPGGHYALPAGIAGGTSAQVTLGQYLSSGNTTNSPGRTLWTSRSPRTIEIVKISGMRPTVAGRDGC